MNKGFIINDSITDGANGIEFHYWLKRENDVAKVIFTGEKAIFFIESDTELSADRRFERKSLNLKAFNGRKVDGLYFKFQKDYLQVKKEFEERGIRTYESDIWANDRFLMERFINGSFEFNGPSQNTKGYETFVNPNIKSCSFVPKFEIMSLDIETSLGTDLYSIAIHQIGTEEIKKVYMIGDLEDRDGVEFFQTEKDLLVKFLRDFQDFNPEVIVGWHVIGFDLKFLEDKCLSLGLKLNLGRNNSEVRLDQRANGQWFANINGRVVLDGPRVLKLAFYQFENFKLSTVSKAVLGGNKDIEAEGSEKIEEIERRFHEDKFSLAKYNLLDCTLVLDIFSKLSLVDHLTKRVLYSGLLLDKLGISTRAFDHIYLPKVHRKGFVANNVLDIQKEKASLGGYVMEAKAGLHEHVVVLDFKSLYPTIIKTFKIDPIGRLHGNIDPVTTVTGVQYSKKEHILPGIIDELLLKRAEAKRNNDQNLSQAVKILMNSFYGVLGSAGCRFYHADLASSITETGQWILKQSIQYIEENGHKVVYGDTDSLFIKLNFLEVGSRDQTANDLAKKINNFLREKIKKQFSVESHLEMEYEKYFSKLFLPFSRGGDQGTKKRYVGLLGNGELYFSGMEYVRSDWTKLAKKFQFELFKKYFHGESLEEFIKDFVAEFKSGLYDDLIIYKKRLSKPLDEYTKSNPPHVKAAKLLREKNPDMFIKDVEYVMTRFGPIPASFEIKDVDYSHYIDKQLAPIGNDVLKFLEKDFDDIVSGSQMTLF